MIDRTPDEQVKLKLIETLRTVTAGKVCNTAFFYFNSSFVSFFFFLFHDIKLFIDLC